MKIKESKLIMRDKPSLNRNIISAPLYLFDEVSWLDLIYFTLVYIINLFVKYFVKYEIRLLSKRSTCLSSEFGKPSSVSMFSKSWLTQVTKVSSRGMLVKSESTSLVNVGSCSLIFSEKWKEFLIMHSFLVKRFNMGAKNLESLYVGICKPNRID